MNRDLNQQEKTNNKKEAILSLILGIVSSLPLLFLVISILSFISHGRTQGESIHILYAAMFMSKSFPLTLITSIIGGVLGVKGLKSGKKNLAKGGIILCIVGFVSSVYMLILYILGG